MLMVIKSISAKSVDISGRRTPQNVFMPERKDIQPAQSVGKLLSCTMTGSITPTIPAATRNAAILSLYRSLLLFQPRPCPNFSARRISNECATLSM